MSHKLDPNKIFKIFSFNKIEVEDDGEIEDFRNTPKYKVGMFSKLIYNGNMFNKHMLNFFTKSTEQFDTQDVKDAGDFMMYHRAYYWISGFDGKSKEWVEALNYYDFEEVTISLDSSIKYFESIEEYEKCAHLSKVKKFLKMVDNKEDSL